MGNWTRSEYLELAGIVVSGLIAFTIYLLQKRLSDKQRVENRLGIEQKVEQKLQDIRNKKHSSKIQLYNTKLLSKKYFSENKRDIWWGYPYHAAELYAANFDGLEFVTGIEEWNKKKYYRIGVIPYENILGIKPEGDGSFNGMIIYVKPRLWQRDRYAIAYKAYRYYRAKDSLGYEVKKPLKVRLYGAVKQALLRARYNFYYRWKHKLQNR
jgi:hypothetical protein